MIEYDKYEVKYSVFEIPSLEGVGRHTFTFIVESDEEECVEEYTDDILQQYFATGNYMIESIVKM